MFKKRRKMTSKASKKLYTKGAKTNSMNTRPRPLRGGTRL